ncbi:hypothetical protein, partial [Algoriphagus sp.]|uniref:hypothetical protein n=1 Tax=Algoriphagus sp. TaxID=1872435 RepID=UPI00271A7586
LPLHYTYPSSKSRQAWDLGRPFREAVARAFFGGQAFFRFFFQVHRDFYPFRSVSAPFHFFLLNPPVFGE